MLQRVQLGVRRTPPREKSVTVPLPGACTRSCTQCDDTAKVISALRHQPTPSWSPTSTMRSVMNCAMHCRMEVSAKVTLNHGPCASSTACPSCSTSLTCTASPAEKSTPSSSSSNSGAPARRDTHASFTGCRLASIGANLLVSKRKLLALRGIRAAPHG